MSLVRSFRQVFDSFVGLGQKRALFTLPALLLLSAGSLHCSDDSSSSGDTSSSSSSSSGEAGMGGAGGAGGAGGMGGGASQSVIGTFRIFDATNAMNISGAPMTYGADMQTTDANGSVMFMLMPGSSYEVMAKPTQFLALHFFGIAGPIDFKSSRGIYSETTISQLMTALGGTYDPTKAIVTVAGAGADFASLPDVLTVDTNVAYDFAAVPDMSSASLYSKGNMTLPGNVSTVILMNVTPGPVPLKVTPPPGKSCFVYPSSMPQGAENVIAYAHEASTVTLLCQ